MAYTLNDLKNESSEEFITAELQTLEQLEATERTQVYPEYTNIEWTATMPATYLRAIHWEQGIRNNSIKANINATNIAKNAANIDVLTIKMDAAELNIHTLQTDLNAAENNITSLQSNMATAETSITALQTDLATAIGYIDTLQSDMDATEQSIEDLERRIPTDYLTEIPIATDTVPGCVKVDGETITVDEDGTIHSAITVEGGNVDLSNYISKTQVGTANGVASLDSNARLPAEQLPEDVRKIITGTSVPESLEEGTVFILYEENETEVNE